MDISLIPVSCVHQTGSSSLPTKSLYRLFNSRSTSPRQFLVCCFDGLPLCLKHHAPAGGERTTLCKREMMRDEARVGTVPVVCWGAHIARGCSRVYEWR